MSMIEKISVALSPELLRQVRKAVDSGKYGSASEVIREALREWMAREPLRSAEIERLRKAWSEGLASGEPESFDIEAIKAKARQRLLRTASAGD